MAQDLSYCGELVRRRDPDRFLLSMFAPGERREALWALLAFNHEIAGTREAVSEAALGFIRLQWWREEIGKIYDGGPPTRHEILIPLAGAIREHALPQAAFETLIEAREFDLDDTLPGNLEGLLNYAALTTAPLLEMAVRVTGCDPDMEPVEPVAVNYALAGLLRCIPHHARAGRCYLPEDMMARHGIRRDSLCALKDMESLPSLVAEAAQSAFVPGIRPDNAFLRASAHLSELYFAQMKALKYDVMAPKMLFGPALKVFRLTWRMKFM